MESFYHVMPIAVRTRDIDAWGHVNNSVFFTYMEMARADYMSQVILQSPIHNLGSTAVILAEVSCQFKKPVWYGQPVVIGTRIVEMRNSSWVVEHRIEADSQLAALGRGTLVHYDYDQSMSLPIPAVFRERITAFENGLEANS